MMTGNSRYKEELTEKFAALVAKRNGNYLDMLFIRRGRIYWQKTPDEVNQEVREALDNRRTQWDLLHVSKRGQY